MPNTETFKAGYVALVGLPNAGKSTLLNALLQFKLTIVTDKPQTTRKKILGLLQGESYQIVFIDTPGILEPKYELQKKLVEYLEESLEDADVICLLYDGVSGNKDHEQQLRRLIPDTKEVIPALTKIDLLSEEKAVEIKSQIQKNHPGREVMPVSAPELRGLKELLDEILAYLPEHPPYYPADQLSDETERFFVTEIIREKIYELYSKEIPYSCHVDIEEFSENTGRKDLIKAVIYVDQPSQKGIIIGKGGQALKQVGLRARRDIETFLDRPVFLELYVKVLRNWRKKMSQLKQLGY